MTALAGHGASSARTDRSQGYVCGGGGAHLDTAGVRRGCVWGGRGVLGRRWGKRGVLLGWRRIGGGLGGEMGRWQRSETVTQLFWTGWIPQQPV